MTFCSEFSEMSDFAAVQATNLVRNLEVAGADRNQNDDGWTLTGL